MDVAVVADPDRDVTVESTASAELDGDVVGQPPNASQKPAAGVGPLDAQVDLRDGWASQS